MILMGIDPSIENVGISYFDTETDELETICFHPKRTKETPIILICVQIARFILISFLQGKKRPEYIVCEYPQWENSERGRIAAQKGYTFALAAIAGYLCGSLGIAASKCFTPTPREWKGNMPKSAVELRFRRRFLVDAKVKISDHEFEAAMMIDWLLNSLVSV